MKLESIQIKNFRAFKDATMQDIPKYCVIVGANGTGKSTIFQLFGFLRDAMKDNVSVALAKLGGGRGFREVRSRNSTGPVEIELKFREDPKKPLITYELAIDENNGNPFVAKEILKYRRGSKGQPWQFLNFACGKGYAVINEYDEVENEGDLKREEQQLKSQDILAIKGLSQFEKYPAVKALGDLVENWHISDFHISDARQENRVSYAEHLSSSGDNLPVVTQFLYNKHRSVFDDILKTIPLRVPGITGVEPKETEEGKVLLRFKDSSFQEEPFLSPFVSDGTIKMFAYLVLLKDPNPHPLLCVEEPENQLYPKLLTELAEEFRDYARRGKQVFVSTHSPDFLDAIELDEVFFIVKQNGYSTIRRARENEQIKRMMDDGDKMGQLWREGYFEEVNPC